MADLQTLRNKIWDEDDNGDGSDDDDGDEEDEDECHQSCSHWENDLSKVTASTWSSWPGSGFFYLLLNVL